MFGQRENTSTSTSGLSNVVDTKNDLAGTNAPSGHGGGVRSKVKALVTASLLMMTGENAEAAQTMGATNPPPTAVNTDKPKPPPPYSEDGMEVPTPLMPQKQLDAARNAAQVVAEAPINGVVPVFASPALIRLLNDTDGKGPSVAPPLPLPGSVPMPAPSGASPLNPPPPVLGSPPANPPGVGMVNAPLVAPPITSQVIDLSKINVTGQVYDNFGIRKDIKHAGVGLFTQSPAGVLHVVALGIEKAGRNNIPDGVMVKVTVETHAGSVDYLIDPKQVPASDKITPTVFREKTHADSGLNSLWQSITKGADGLQVRVRVDRVDPSNVTFTYVMGREFTDQASLKMTFVKP